MYMRFKKFNKLFEANLAGSTVNYHQPTGAFYKYVEMAADPEKDYEALKDGKLFDVNTSEVVDTIEKGTNFKILDKKEKDLEMIGRSYTTRILLNKKEYRIALSGILKPSGKHVDFIQVDLKDKEDPTVWTTFKGGHGHEAEIAKVFIEGSGGNWEFEHREKEYHITRIGPPEFKGGGNPKTDLLVELEEGMRGYGNPAILKYSLKAPTATFVENWMMPIRFEQIFGRRKSIQIIEDTYNKFNEDETKVLGKSKAPTAHWFVKDKKNKTGIFLNRKEHLEAFSGAKKFADQKEAIANCFFYGDAPKTITALLDNTSTISNNGVEVGLEIRGYGKNTNSACFVRQGKGWAVRDNWIRYFRLDKKYRQGK